MYVFKFQTHKLRQNLNVSILNFNYDETLGYSPSQIWVPGSCKTASIAAHLKKKYHEQGINFISEQSYIDLEKEMLDSQIWIVRLFAKWNLIALKARDIPSAIGSEIEEDNFSTEKKMGKTFSFKKGKSCHSSCHP